MPIALADSSTGGKRHTGEGARIGAIVFGVIGAVGGAAMCGSWGDAPCTSALGAVVTGAAFGALVGAVLGAVIGSQYVAP